jgi:predicted DNA binding CopG/RHH family protein
MEDAGTSCQEKVALRIAFRYLGAMASPKLDLVLIAIRLHRKDVKAAKALAKKLQVPYQQLIRGWVAEKIQEVRK